jgi:hypothetical protein
VAALADSGFERHRHDAFVFYEKNRCHVSVRQQSSRRRGMLDVLSRRS